MIELYTSATPNGWKVSIRVLDTRLADREYLADQYSIADMATWPWVKLHGWAGVEIGDLPHLQAWIDRIAERPAVQKGLAVPGDIDPEVQQKWLDKFRTEGK